jgi:hypothetical protein
MKRNYKSGLLGTHIVVVCVHAFPDEGWSRTTRVVSLHCCCGSCFVLYNGQANFAMPKYFLRRGIISFYALTCCLFNNSSYAKTQLLRAWLPNTYKLAYKLADAQWFKANCANI